MTGANRLPAPAGRLIARDAPVSFSFEGKRYQGLQGDTLASALAANNVWLLSRSFKYHRPRGVLTMAGLDGNTYAQLGDEPNVPADRLPIRDGLAAMGQNYRGSLWSDRLRGIEAVSRFLPVGFYYRAFFKPRGAWRRWEPVIRATAGLGKVDLDAHHDYYDKAYAFADVGVIGGGAAGMNAALAAARAGAEVILIDDQPGLGGALLYARFDADRARGEAVAEELSAAVAAEPRITVMSAAICTGWFSDNWLAVIKGKRLTKLRAKAVVAATGALEQPMVFRNNDLPGVMLGSAAQRLIRLYGVRPGTRAVVAAGNDDGYAVALDLVDAGVEVKAVADLRPYPPPSAFNGAVAARGIRVLRGHAVHQAVPRHDRRHVGAAVIDAVTGEGEVAGRPETIDCDLIVMSVGWSPMAQLLCQAGARLVYDDALASYVIDGMPRGAVAAGNANGAFDLDAVLRDGTHSGWQAATMAGFTGGAEPAPAGEKGAAGRSHPWPIFPHWRGKDFVDFDEDIQVKDIVNAIADGFDDLELVKRYTTAGMGPSQGKQSSVNLLRVATRANGRGDGAGGSVTTQRPPFVAESFGHLAGRSFDPVRRTAMHHRHVEAGAQMMVAGAWLRPAYYGRPEERDAAIRAEAKAVRSNVGIIDVSTLGGLEIRGPDAAELLERMYTGAYAKQPVGRSRYVLMCDMTGAIIDDGVACRLGEQHFYVTATTTGVDRVFQQMQRWNAEWRLDVDIAGVTQAYAGVNITGPQSRVLLQKLDCDIDLSPEAFPYLGMREGRVGGMPARLLRVGFVGELGYEIHAPASQGEALWDLLMEAGREFSIKPFGVEAQRLLRLEKGHVIVGQDTDGLTHPHEADMTWAIARGKPFFVGKHAIEIQMRAPLTRKLVGFTLPSGSPVPEECHLVVRGDDIVGRVTSAAASEACGRVIGLAYVAPDQAAPGDGFEIKIAGEQRIWAEVCALPFYDPGNKRQEL